MDIRESASDLSSQVLIVILPSNSTPKLEDFLSFLTEVNTTSQCLSPVVTARTEEQGRDTARSMNLPFCLFIKAGRILADFRHTLKMISDAKPVKTLDERSWFEVLDEDNPWIENGPMVLSDQKTGDAMAHQNSKELENAIFNGGSMQSLTQGQREFVEYAESKKKIFYNRVYFIDGESPQFEMYPGKPITFVGVPSSLKLEYMAYRYGYSTKTVVKYIDVSEAALDYRRYLIENWDGKNYSNFALRYMRDHDMLWQIQTSSRKSRQFRERCTVMFKAWELGTFPTFWKDFVSKVKFEYVQVDLVSEPQKVLRLTPDYSVVWWSNVFDYFYSAFTHDKNEVQKAHQTLLSGMAAKDDVIVYERDPEYVVPKRG